MTYRLGIDVGGTFTDLFLWSAGGGVETFKVLSTPRDPSEGVLDGFRAIAESKGLSVEKLAGEIDTVVHGTTVTTNAVLTRRGARTGLLTTRGFRDALEMRRGIRERQYDNRYKNVEPLVPRHLRLGIQERCDRNGGEIVAVSRDEVRRAAAAMKREGVDAVAICFLNAFANPAHEREAAALVEEVLPDAYLSVSSEVLPTVRFYNRVSTTVLNAFVGPVLRGYLQSLTAKLWDVGFRGVLLIMQSNGGVALPEVTRRLPASTLLSGPAAGPRAAAVLAEPYGRDCILVDMGGTSFDTSLVRAGGATMRTEGEIDRLRIALPMLEITTIGAGGGSIGWMDEGGLLRMGPQSAGALPGPACYGRGGELPTCTDADLVLGYLDPEFFAGAKLRLRADLAKAAIEQHIARPLGLSLEMAAAGMYRVINANMAHGVREITVKRGLDPREFPMVVAGGAAAIHACMIADELEIPTLLVPATASVLCAAGMLMSDLGHDFVRSRISPLSKIDTAELCALVDQMTAEGGAQLRSEGVDDAHVEHSVALDLRYLKQYHEVTVGVSIEDLRAGRLEPVRRSLHAEHNRLYGYDLAEEGTDIELINVRVRSTGVVAKPTLPRVERGSRDPTPAQKSRRAAFVPERSEFLEIPVFDGHRLVCGNVIDGPALVERTDTTIFVTSSFVASIDALGSCLLRRRAGGGTP